MPSILIGHATCVWSSGTVTVIGLLSSVVPARELAISLGAHRRCQHVDVLVHEHVVDRDFDRGQGHAADLLERVDLRAPTSSGAASNHTHRLMTCLRGYQPAFARMATFSRSASVIVDMSNGAGSSSSQLRSNGEPIRIGGFSIQSLAESCRLRGQPILL